SRLPQLLRGRFVGTPFKPAETRNLERVAILEQKMGPLPLSLCAWFEQVGEVDLTQFLWGVAFAWDRKSLPSRYTDAFQFHEIDSLLMYQEHQWYGNEYQIEFSGDAIHKDGYSGGDPYALLLPNAGIDALVTALPYSTSPNGFEDLPFVTYLRHCFAW